MRFSELPALALAKRNLARTQVIVLIDEIHGRATRSMGDHPPNRRKKTNCAARWRDTDMVNLPEFVRWRRNRLPWKGQQSALNGADA